MLCVMFALVLLHQVHLLYSVNLLAGCVQYACHKICNIVCGVIFNSITCHLTITAQAHFTEILKAVNSDRWDV